MINKLEALIDQYPALGLLYGLACIALGFGMLVGGNLLLN